MLARMALSCVGTLYPVRVALGKAIGRAAVLRRRRPVGRPERRAKYRLGELPRRARDVDARQPVPAADVVVARLGPRAKVGAGAEFEAGHALQIGSWARDLRPITRPSG